LTQWPLTYDLENNKISWRPISPILKPYFVKKSSNSEFLCLNLHNCTLESKDVQVHSSHMLNEMFVKLSKLREPNMKMCTLVVYPGPLSFFRVMPVWTWKFDTIHHALCHHNSSHMLNGMFVKLSILEDPNMKICTLVPYPHLHIRFSQFTKFYKHLIKHVGGVVMTKCMVNCLKISKSKKA
jgi:hypothetical protein